MGNRGNTGKSSPEQPILFPPFRLLPLEQQLFRDDELVPLRPKALAILKCLLTRPGQLFPREELLSLIWGDVRLSEGVLKTQIAEIRQALGDSAREPRYIETQHRRGYRFIGRVESTAATLAGLGDDGVSEPVRRDEPAKTAHFVGRDTELAALEQCRQQAAGGERQVVFVTGETGVGKTALVNVFLRALFASEVPCFVTWGQCIDQSESGEPFLPIVEAARRLCAADDGTEVSACLLRHAPTWRKVMPNLAASDPLDPAVAALPGRMLREMAEALEALSELRPLCLLIEDAQWADDSTLDLIAYLAQRSNPARLLVLATHRPHAAGSARLGEISDTLLARHRCSELAVPALSEGEIGDYLARRFDGRPPAHALCELAQRQTEGNALFLVSLVDHWLERGLLDAGGDRCEPTTSLDELSRAAPQGIVRRIERELERLDAFERSVLEAASVAGREFSTAALAAALGADGARVEETCLRWARSGQFFRSLGKAEWEDGTETERYEFLHVLYQQHAYARLGGARQGQLHRKLGERLESGYGAATEKHVELAVHFERGRDYERAVRYFAQAGERALERSAYREGLDHLRRALTLSTRLPETSDQLRSELDIQLLRAAALRHTKGYAAQEVAAAYARASELCERCGAESERLLVMVGMGGVELLRGQSSNALEFGRKLLAAAEADRNSTGLSAGHLLTGIAHHRLGSHRKAEAHLEAVVAGESGNEALLSARLMTEEFASTARCYLAYSWCLRGYFDRAKSEIALALREAAGLGSPFLEAHALAFASTVHRLCGDWDGAYEMAETLDWVARERGFEMLAACTTHLRGAVWRARGDWERAADMLSRGLASFRATGSTAYVSQYVAMLAESYGELADGASGLALLDQALSSSRAGVERLWDAELFRVKGELLAQRALARESEARSETETSAEAEHCLVRAVAIAQEQEAKLLELRAATSLFRFQHACGNAALERGERIAVPARALLEEIHAWFADGPRIPELEEAEALLSELGERDVTAA